MKTIVLLVLSACAIFGQSVIEDAQGNIKASGSVQAGVGGTYTGSVKMQANGTGNIGGFTVPDNFGQSIFYTLPVLPPTTTGQALIDFGPTVCPTNDPSIQSHTCRKLDWGSVGSGGGGGGSGTGSATVSPNYGPVLGPIMIPPSSWSWVNQGGATMLSTNGAITITAPANSGHNVRALVMVAPTPPYTIDTLLIPQLVGRNYQDCGVLFRESGTGKLGLFYLLVAADNSIGQMGYSLGADYFSSPTTGVANLFRADITSFQPWLRIQDSGVNRVFSYSTTGITWTQLYSESRTANYTADQVGFYCDELTNAYPAAMTVVSWSQH